MLKDGIAYDPESRLSNELRCFEPHFTLLSVPPLAIIKGRQLLSVVQSGLCCGCAGRGPGKRQRQRRLRRCQNRGPKSRQRGKET